MKSCVVAIAALLPVCSFGGTISLGLYDTGVNADGSLATAGSIDQHYTSTNDSPVYVTSPYAGWAVSSSADYDSPDTDSGASYDDGVYTLDYTTTFDLPDGYVPGTVMITGGWSTDDHGLDILVNGNPTDYESPGFSGYSSFTLSGATGFFVDGVNTITFEWENTGGPGGISVEFDSDTASTPEPATFGLIGLGMGLLGLFGRKPARN